MCNVSDEAGNDDFDACDSDEQYDDGTDSEEECWMVIIFCA